MALTHKQLIELRNADADGAGNRLSAAMKLAGVTQVVLGESIHESQPYISDVVRGRYQTITLAKARKFATYFGCFIEDLFPGSESREVAS